MLPELKFHCPTKLCGSARNVRGVDGYGAQGRDRTTDTAIFSRMLYQLSYLGPQSGTGWRRERGAV